MISTLQTAEGEIVEKAVGCRESLRGDASGPTMTFRVGDVLEGEPCLPGFRLALHELFSELDRHSG